MRIIPTILNQVVQCLPPTRGQWWIGERWFPRGRCSPKAPWLIEVPRLPKVSIHPPYNYYLGYVMLYALLNSRSICTNVLINLSSLNRFTL
jgi:hypothetical protein